MDYNLKLCDETLAVEVETRDGDTFDINVAGKTLNVTYHRISDHHINIEIDGRRINAYVLDEADGKAVSIDGIVHSVVDMDVRERHRADRSGAADLPDEITPRIPSVVIAVLVNPGDVVEKGRGLVVLSAMKMETTLFAPYDGKVIAVNVEVGDKVMPGAILVELEKEGEG